MVMVEFDPNKVFRWWLFNYAARVTSPVEKEVGRREAVPSFVGRKIKRQDLKATIRDIRGAQVKVGAALVLRSYRCSIMNVAFFSHKILRKERIKYACESICVSDPCILGDRTAASLVWRLTFDV